MSSFTRSAFSSPSGRMLATACSAVAWVPALIFVADNTYWIAHVRGRSMAPSFNTPSTPDALSQSPGNRASSAGTSNSDPVSRDTILLSLYKPAANLRRGDIIAFRSPKNPENMAIKRIVALENDEVQTRPPYPFRRELVPPGHVWVEGDNPEGRFSLDSNEYGPISKSLVAGKVIARLWPDAKMVRPEEWEASDLRLRDGRIRKNVGNAMRPRIYSS